MAVFYVRDLYPHPPPPPSRRTRAWAWLRMETGQQETLRPIDMLLTLFPTLAWIVFARLVLGPGWSQWGLLVMIGGLLGSRRYIRSSGRREW